MPFISSNNLLFHCEWNGPENAPVLVLSNSLGTNLSLWDPQIPIFERDFRVLRYDSRGHGESGVSLRDYSIELLARDVVGLLDTLNLERVYFCGLSIGGMTGMWLGVHAPERLHKLVLCNTSPQIGNAQTWNARILSVRSGGTKVIAPSVVERWFTPEFRAKYPETVAKTKEMIETTNPDGYMASCAAVRDFNFWPEVAGIRTPTLVLAGTHDPAVPPADSERLAREIKGAKYAELNAAHISNIEAADKFTSEVSAFLRGSD
ncbi:MAG: 3-oxoadipate enol-lactonase [Acidobacteriota bacterium]|nr:3-oxoadipate enol-lactonase [Acidobacteriota bacterium]